MTPTEKRATFQAYHGPLNDPNGYIEYMMHAARQTGRTTALIDCVPVDQNVVIVGHSHRWNSEIAKRLQQERPEIDIRRIFFISVPDPFQLGAELMERTRGMQIDCVLIDNAVLDMLTYNLQHYINDTMVEFTAKRKFV